ncbi:tyrosine-protein phosphatase [Streptomyces morookaense]|uniref:Tyrosine-protein phosphatase n=1 Tax=Streptomyces morookaense TaxID=1970 RepID=A0A7Y7E7N4_STRMO|nr:tyrosine-protein phosphatase [Streptomyces morookaense]NVK79143.1 tyrosine-protein phosphatase [Streptomyces morookaense]
MPFLRRALASGAALAALAGGVALGGAPAVAQPRAALAHASIHTAIADAQVVRDADGVYRLTWTADGPSRVTRVYASTDPAPRPAHRRLVETTKGTSATVRGLDPIARWYFTLASGGRSETTAARTVTLDGVANSRDLGGYPADGGRRIRWGAVFRSARLTPATDTGKQQLAALGLREVVDFRSTAEATREGLDPLPPEVSRIADPIGDPDQAVEPPPAPSGDPIADNYRLFVSNPNLRKQFADGLLRAADRGQRPLMFHCTGGNHRTGWMTVVLLKALGVPDSVVRQDYLLSPNTSDAYLNAAYDQIQRDFGSFSAYLDSGLGIPPEKLSALRASLLVRA